MKWLKSLTPEQLKELNRLKKDGHSFETDRKNHIFTPSLESVRNTQLYRTLLHEIGHYKHFLELVGESEDSSEEETYEEYELRNEKYHNLEHSIKEKYAHHFADKFKAMLERINIIPFDRIE